jgi:hypothetical protein
MTHPAEVMVLEATAAGGDVNRVWCLGGAFPAEPSQQSTTALGRGIHAEGCDLALCWEISGMGILPN